MLKMFPVQYRLCLGSNACVCLLLGQSQWTHTGDGAPHIRHDPGTRLVKTHACLRLLSLFVRTMGCASSSSDQGTWGLPTGPETLGIFKAIILFCTTLFFVVNTVHLCLKNSTLKTDSTIL